MRKVTPTPQARTLWWRLWFFERDKAMFKVLKIDGPHIITDKGMVTLSTSQYADGGKTFPASEEDWLKMRDLFVAAPQLHRLVAALASWFNEGDSAVSGSSMIFESDETLHGAILSAMAAVKGGTPQAAQKQERPVYKAYQCKDDPKYWAVSCGVGGEALFHESQYESHRQAAEQYAEKRNREPK